MPKVALIIAFKDFRDPEYFVPKKILEDNQIEVTTASNEVGEALGAEGGKTKVDLKLKDLDVTDFKAIVFIGGSGALVNLDNEDSYKLIHQAVEQNKMVAAICIAPTILAKAGVLKNKKATAWLGAIQTLKENGAIIEDKDVVVDGLIVTAIGPKVAQEFGQKLVDLLR